MDEGIKKGLAFSVNEDQVREDFVNYLLETKEIPPDASTAAQIVKIKKHYQLFSKCEGPYTAHWGSRCIWEHTEEYTYKDTETVFVDKYGTEYSYQYDGTTPVSREVTKTGYRTVVDRVEQVNRKINNNYSELIHAQGVVTPLSNWIIERFSKEKTTVASLSDGDFSGCTVTEQRDRGRVTTLADTNCKNACLSYVKTIIPGNRYVNFTFDFKGDFKISEEYYIPVYQVEYTYNHRQYEVWFSGYEKGVWFSEKTPNSSKIKSPGKVSKLLYTSSIVFFVIDAALLVLATMIGNSQSLSTMWTLLTIILIVFGAFIGCLIAGGIFGKINSITSGRWTDVKSQLTEIYHNEEMTLQIRKLKMEQIVKKFVAEETKISRRRKRRILIPTISILVIISSVLIAKQVIIPMVNYNNAEKLLASGKYSEAVEAFQNLGDFKDSKNKVAKALVAKGDYVSAIALYEELGNQEKAKEYASLAIDQQVAESKEVGRQTQIGSVITIGNYDAVVLNKESDRILIMFLRYNGPDHNRNLNTVYEKVYDYKSSSWENSSLRKFLNNDFLDEFQESINRLILEVDLPNVTQSGENLGTTKDKVFLLSAVSDKPYIDAIIGNGMIINSTTFTRTPASSTTVVSIDVWNNFDGTGNHYAMGEQEVDRAFYIRPCAWLDIS